MYVDYEEEHKWLLPLEFVRDVVIGSGRDLVSSTSRVMQREITEVLREMLRLLCSTISPLNSSPSPCPHPGTGTGVVNQSSHG